MKLAFAAVAACAYGTVPSVLAQDEATDQPVAAESADAAEAAPAQAANKKENAFYPLMRCRLIEDCSVQVLKPRTSDWTPAIEGHYYPLGSTLRVTPSEGRQSLRVEFAFGEKAVLTATGAVEFATKELAAGDQSRTVIMKRGRFSLDLPRALGEGLFTVAAPFFACENLAGESLFDYTATGDGDEVVVRCVTGSMSLDGRHYKIARMGAANQVRIRTTGDDLFTSLRGESGEFKVMLDAGVIPQKNFETGEVTDVPKTLEFSLSPKCAIKIFRAKSQIGGRMIVSTMTFSSTGEMQNRFVFAEGLSNVNSGELVVSTTLAEAEKEKAKKTDAEAEEVESVEAKPEEEAPAAEGEKEEKKSEESSI